MDCYKTRVLSVIGMAALAGLTIFGGCQRGAQELTLDKELARDSFVQFLESWKSGETPAALQERAPAIIAGDPEWEAQARLVSYRLLDVETDDGTNLHATVELVLLEAGGRQRKPQVTYIVGTSPVITIFRE